MTQRISQTREAGEPLERQISSTHRNLTNKERCMNELFAVTLSSSVESSELFLKAIRHLWLLHCFPVQFDSQQNSHA